MNQNPNPDKPNEESKGKLTDLQKKVIILKLSQKRKELEKLKSIDDGSEKQKKNK
ncbi:hypothetical protein [Sediminibacterium sp.]|uniref:hypothetical protein n=1 Tax=Sediminibacterium sp. TaxID=1917865 RepID=UPI003F6FF58B